MSYRIEKAKQLRNNINALEQELRKNARALSAVREAKASKSIIEEFKTKEDRLQRKLLKTQKKYNRYVDDNLKVSDMPKVLEQESVEEYDYNYYDEY